MAAPFEALLTHMVPSYIAQDDESSSDVELEHLDDRVELTISRLLKLTTACIRADKPNVLTIVRSWTNPMYEINTAHVHFVLCDTIKMVFIKDIVLGRTGSSWREEIQMKDDYCIELAIRECVAFMFGTDWKLTSDGALLKEKKRDVAQQLCKAACVLRSVMPNVSDLARFMRPSWFDYE